MADSFVRLPADGAGKLLDTRTAPDGDHREVVVVGSPTLADVAEADATNGLDVDVTRLPALPAGTNNIGDVDIVSLPNEGQQTMANSISVAIASDQSTVPVSLAAGGTTQYAEDSAHVSGDLVTLAGVVQQSADAALSSDGDRSILQVDASGFLKVNIKAGAGAGGTAMADDAAFTPAVTQGTPSFAFADETAPDSVDEGDAGALRMTLDRKLLTRVVGATDANRLDVDGSGHAQVDIAAASVTVPVSNADMTAAAASLAIMDDWDETDRAKVNPIVGQAGVAAGAGAVGATVQRVTLASDDPAVAALQILDNAIAGSEMQVDIVSGSVGITGAVDTELPAAAALADNTANPTAPAVGAFGQVWDGATWDRTPGTSADGALVNLGANNDVSLNAGSNNIGDVDVLSVIPGTGATNLGKSVDSVPGATDTGVAALVVRDDVLAALTPADGDYTNLRTNSTGALWTTELNAALIAASVQLLGSDTYVEAVSHGMAVGAVRHDADTTLVGTTEEWTPFQVDANGRLKVEAFSGETLPVSLATLPALVAGSANIGDVDIASVAAGTVMEVVGDVAADAAVPANPVAIGGRASIAVPTAVSADGDSVFQWLNRNGLTLVSGIPGAGLNADPYTLLSETAQYTTTQTSAVLVTGGASERIIVTSIQIQAGGTTAGTLQVYFGTGAYARGTDEAIFDGEFAPSATLKPGFVSSPPSGYRAGALGDDILVTTSAAINPLTITVWYYVLGV